MSATVVIKGARAIELRFGEFPAKAHQMIEQRITALTDVLQARIEAAAPVKTGRLRSEIKGRIYADQANRVAGYVSVYSPEGGSNEYAKAATLEYGTNKPRRAFSRLNKIEALLGQSKRRIIGKMSKPVHIQAFAYLRGPLEQMRPEIEAALNDAIAATVTEEST